MKSASDHLRAPPSLTLLGMEPLRAALEYTSMRMMNAKRLPKGDGHPVVIFPGLATDQSSTAPLHDCCAGLGYSVYDWGRGFNTGPSGRIDAWFDDLAFHVERLTRKHRPKKVSLVGWSLGGIYAREIAKRRPSLIRQVITIGTPFAGTGSDTHAGWVVKLMGGQPPNLAAGMATQLRTPPPVPSTSIYSRSDGVVAWQACHQPSNGGQTENVEVESSHMGLVWNPKVLAVIADRLRQPEGSWQPYR